MAKAKIKKYVAEICGHCNQSTSYVLTINKGTADIVKAIAIAIRAKGVNEIHPRKELEIASNATTVAAANAQGKLTSTQVSNMSHPRMHGLIAQIDDKPGHYCLTRKGAKFLRGEPTPKFAIISKSVGHNIGYWYPYDENKDNFCTIRDFDGPGEYWELVDLRLFGDEVVERSIAEQVALPV